MYRRIHFRCPRERVDFLEERLQQIGAVAVTCENAGEGDHLDAAVPQAPEWSLQRITGLFDADVDVAVITEGVTECLPGVDHEGDDLLQDQDWETAWAADWVPVEIVRGLWVCPSWCDPPDAAAVNLIIDPGLAFGTGTHPTTALCIDWMARNPPVDEVVVDVGCGSGILAIAALRLGARWAMGVDIDPRALQVSVANAEKNGVGSAYVADVPPAAWQVEGAGLVVVNILANVIIEMSDDLAALVAPRAVILLTGILTRQREAVVAAFPDDFEFDHQERDGWILLIGRRCIQS